MNALSFSIMTMFASLQPLPSEDVFQSRVESFTSAYGVQFDQTWSVETRDMNNPSPFLTKVSQKHCTFYINTNENAQKVWNYLTNVESVDIDTFITFAVGHEILHCLAAQPNEGTRMRAFLEPTLEQGFNSRHHFEEISGDLLGLAYAKRLHEMQYLALSKQVKMVRTSFASSNTTHASQDYLSDDAVQMMELTIAE